MFLESGESRDGLLLCNIQLVKNLEGKLPRFSSSPQTILYPVRKPRCLPCTPCGAGLAAGTKTIPFSANPVRDLSLNGTNRGFNAPCEPSRYKVADFLTGFTLSYLLHEINHFDG